MEGERDSECDYSEENMSYSSESDVERELFILRAKEVVEQKVNERFRQKPVVQTTI
jgi:hypothetical protein